MMDDKLYGDGAENLTTGRKTASAAKPDVLVDYDDGVNRAHANLQAAKAVGLYNADFYRGFCACLQGFGQARQRKTARWKCISIGIYSCSLCGCEPWYAGSINTIRYCPNCGAKMAEVDE